MRALIVDNYDSFTFNLVHQVGRLVGQTPLVFTNDGISLQEIEALAVDAIVISPGPGRPGKTDDFGICGQIIAAEQWPILGVCLGHQGIARHYGCTISHAPAPVHGQVSRLRHAERDLFQGLPQDFEVVRYHSLAVAGELPPELEATAWTEDGILMALRHRSLPVWGVQFHPESISTECGDHIVRRFLELAGCRTDRLEHAPDRPRSCRDEARKESAYSVLSRRLDLELDSEDVFCRLFAEEDNAFWLDSSAVSPGYSRFSYLGACGGESGYVVRYRSRDRQLRIRRGDRVEERTESIFDFLDRQLRSNFCSAPDLPFDFTCGFVGYFGYELKAECGADDAHRSPQPDAIWLFAERLIVVDHAEGHVYVVARAPRAPGRALASAQAWIDETARTLGELTPVGPPPRRAEPSPVSLYFERDEATYLEDIETCLEKIRDGESYEICLTNRVQGKPVEDPLALYRILRQVNPAPYAAYLRFDDLAVLCSSPEQFLRVDRRRTVSSRPIKGTAAREVDPSRDEEARRRLAQSTKDRAENLMIVDLLRNDLGRVCELGSVHVPSMMDVESYATVHQLVSTIEGRLAPEVSVLDCVRAAFPGGSMTGAPKLRTMEIIDSLEPSSRGIYSGSIGFLGLNGTADLNIVIRTLVNSADQLTLGTGGAIVAQSDPASECAEIRLKCKALIHALSLLAERRDSVLTRRALDHDAAQRADCGTAVDPRILGPNPSSPEVEAE